VATAVPGAGCGARSSLGLGFSETEWAPVPDASFQDQSVDAVPPEDAPPYDAPAASDALCSIGSSRCDDAGRDTGSDADADVADADADFVDASDADSADDDVADSAATCPGLDFTFAAHGLGQFPSPPHPYPSGFALQSDGKILVLGYNPLVPSNEAALVARYLPDGSPDTTFGQAGVATIPVAHGITFPLAVAVQPDGKIVVSGLQNSENFFLVRLDPTGALDTGFGTNGFATQPTLGARPWALAVRPNGSILVAGDQFISPSDPILVAQYDSTGKIDPTFGTAGSTVLVVGSSATAQHALLQPDGKLLVAGHATPGAAGHWVLALARFAVDGSLDTTFGSGGTTTTDTGAQYAFASGLATQSTGAIVVSADDDQNALADFRLVRYTPDGQLDVSFGTNGVAHADFFGAEDRPVGVSVLPGDALVVAGQVSDSMDAGVLQDVGLARFTADGSLDATFGNGGRLVVYRFPAGLLNAGVALQLLQPDGKLLMCGAYGASPAGTQGTLVLLRACL
jgi:uncharacterized delta-60 repeat protein